MTTAQYMTVEVLGIDSWCVQRTCRKVKLNVRAGHFGEEEQEEDGRRNNKILEGPSAQLS